LFYNEAIKYYEKSRCLINSTAKIILYDDSFTALFQAITLLTGRLFICATSNKLEAYTYIYSIKPIANEWHTIVGRLDLQAEVVNHAAGWALEVPLLPEFAHLGGQVRKMSFYMPVLVVYYDKTNANPNFSAQRLRERHTAHAQHSWLPRSGHLNPLQTQHQSPETRDQRPWDHETPDLVTSSSSAKTN